MAAFFFKISLNVKKSIFTGVFEVADFGGHHYIFGSIKYFGLVYIKIKLYLI